MPNTIRPDRPSERGLPWYFISIVGFFLLPVIFLLAKMKTLQYPAFFKAVGLVIFLGYAWSTLVSSSGWWEFDPRCMLGIQVLPHLPLEEVLFYPLGGALSILLYVALAGANQEQARAGRICFLLMLALTCTAVVLILISILGLGNKPYYLLSQLALFNALSLGLWFLPRARVFLRPAGMAVALMTILGFGWNWLAFTQGWWSYHAVLGWMLPPRVPIDDWNFFVFAPLAAMSVYELFTRRGG